MEIPNLRIAMEKHVYLKWGARSMGLAAIGYILFFAFSAGFQDMELQGSHKLWIESGLGVSVVGYLLAWRFPVSGGSLMIVGALLMGSYVVINGGITPIWMDTLAVFLIGLAFLGSVDRELI